jgi:hypothetical protein
MKITKINPAETREWWFMGIHCMNTGRSHDDITKGIGKNLSDWLHNYKNVYARVAQKNE